MVVVIVEPKREWMEDGWRSTKGYRVSSIVIDTRTEHDDCQGQASTMFVNRHAGDECAIGATVDVGKVKETNNLSIKVRANPH